MKKKSSIIVLFAIILTLLAQTAFASEIDGSWKGKIYASKYGITVSRSASVTFTAEGGYTLNTGSGDSVGTYVLSGNKITLTSTSGRVIKLTWKLSGDTLTMTGNMDYGGYSNLSTRMVVKRQIPKITSVSCPKVDFGSASVITVKTNDMTQQVKIELADGTVLASSSESAETGLFKLSATLPSVKTKVTVCAGKTENGETVWYGKKSATLNTYAMARLTKINKAAVSAKTVPVSETVTVSVTANDKTTKVRIVGAETVESDKYEVVDGKRVFTVSYTQSLVKKNQKLKIYSGDEFGFKAAAGKTVKVSFTA